VYLKGGIITMKGWYMYTNVKREKGTNGNEDYSIAAVKKRRRLDLMGEVREGYVATNKKEKSNPISNQPKPTKPSGKKIENPAIETSIILLTLVRNPGYRESTLAALLTPHPPPNHPPPPPPLAALPDVVTVVELAADVNGNPDELPRKLEDGVGCATAVAVPVRTFLRASNFAFASSASCFATASAVLAATSSRRRASSGAGAWFSDWARIDCIPRLLDRLLKVGGGMGVFLVPEFERPSRSSRRPPELLFSPGDVGQSSLPRLCRMSLSDFWSC